MDHDAEDRWLVVDAERNDAVVAAYRPCSLSQVPQSSFFINAIAFPLVCSLSQVWVLAALCACSHYIGFESRCQ